MCPLRRAGRLSRLRTRLRERGDLGGRQPARKGRLLRRRASDRGLYGEPLARVRTEGPGTDAACPSSLPVRLHRRRASRTHSCSRLSTTSTSQTICKGRQRRNRLRRRSAPARKLPRRATAPARGTAPATAMPASAATASVPLTVRLQGRATRTTATTSTTTITTRRFSTSLRTSTDSTRRTTRTRTSSTRCSMTSMRSTWRRRGRRRRR